MDITNLAHVDTEDLITELESRSVAAVGTFFIVGHTGETNQYDSLKGDICLRLGMSQYIEATTQQEAMEEFYEGYFEEEEEEDE